MCCKECSPKSVIGKEKARTWDWAGELGRQNLGLSEEISGRDHEKKKGEERRRRPWHDGWDTYVAGTRMWPREALPEACIEQSKIQMASNWAFIWLLVA